MFWPHYDILAFFCSFRSEKMIYHQFKYVLKFCNCSIETIFCDDQTLKISWNHKGMKPCRFLFFSCSPIPKLQIRISQFFLTNYRLEIYLFVKHMLLVKTFLKIHDSWVRNWCWIHWAKYLCMWMKKAADEKNLLFNILWSFSAQIWHESQMCLDFLIWKCVMTNKVGGSWQDFYFTESQHFYRKERKKMVSGRQIRIIYQKNPAH